MNLKWKNKFEQKESNCNASCRQQKAPETLHENWIIMQVILRLMCEMLLSVPNPFPHITPSHTWQETEQLS